MATLTIPDHTLARLRAAAEARRISLEAYLAEVAMEATGEESTASSASAIQRSAAADSIQQLAAEIKNKATIEELIADKHAGHKY